MTRRSGAHVLLSLLLAVGAFSEATAQEETPRLDAAIDVIVVNLDVIVTDRDGRRVHGLSPADFEIEENGEVRPITNFSEIDLDRAGSSTDPAEPVVKPSRKIIIFVDNLTLDFFNRRRVFGALRDFVKTSLIPEDEVMVVGWNRRLRIEVPPTNDRARIESGLVALEKQVSADGAARKQQLQREIAGIDTNITGGDAAQLTRARVEARAAMTDVRQTTAAIRAVLTRLGGVGGRKVLVLVTEGLQMQPGRELFDGLADPRAALTGTETDATSLMESIVSDANAAGVTIYAIHGAGTVSDMSVEDTSPTPAAARADSASNSYSSLAHIASRTGGTASFRSGPGRAFNRIAADLSAYYSIGYRSESSGREGERQIRVRMKSPGHTARTRSSFVEKGRHTDIREQVVASLYFAPASSQIEISARAGEPRTLKRGQVLVPIEIRVPASGLTFVRNGEQYTALFSVLLAATDGNHSTSEVVERRFTVSFPANELETAQEDAFTHVIDIQTSEGNRVAVAVVDAASTVAGFATVPVPSRKARRRAPASE